MKLLYRLTRFYYSAIRQLDHLTPAFDLLLRLFLANIFINIRTDQNTNLG